MATERIQIIVTESGSRVVSAALDQIGRSSQQANAAVGLFKSTLASLGAGLGFREIAAYSDVFTGMQNRLQIVTKSSEELKNVTNELFRSANATRTSFESNVVLFTRMAQATDTLGISQKELLKITETINKTIAISGANSIEAKNALIQFSQGIASGTLRGDELRSVLEQLPGLAQQIAKGMGVAYGELRTLAKEGALTPQVIFEAIQKQQAEIDALFAKTTPTIAQSFQRLENEVIKFIGNSKEMNTAMRLISTGIILVADNLGLLSNAALAVTAVFATRFVFAALAPATTALIGLATSLGTTVVAMATAGSVSAATSVAFAGTATATGILTAAVGALRTAFVFLTATPLGLAITAVATVFAAFALTTGGAKASTGEFTQALNELRGPAASAEAELRRTAAATEELTKKQREQVLLKQQTQRAETEGRVRDIQRDLLSKVNLRSGFERNRGNIEVAQQFEEISRLLKGNASDAEKAAEAFARLTNQGKLASGAGNQFVIDSKNLSEGKAVLELLIPKINELKQVFNNFGIALPEPITRLPEELQKMGPATAEAQAVARDYSGVLQQLADRGKLTGEALANTAKAFKEMKEDSGPSAEALKIINDKFEELGITAPSKTTATAEALKILQDALKKTEADADQFRNQITLALESLTEKRLELNGADAVQQELLNLTNKFREGKISAEDLRAALGTLQGANPSFDLSGINSLIGKALQAIGVINNLRSAASGIQFTDGKRSPADQGDRQTERDLLATRNFEAEQRRVANLSKRDKAIEDRERSLRQDALSRGINLPNARGLASDLVDAEASGRGAKKGGGGKKEKSEGEKEAEAYKKQLEEIQKPQQEFKRNQRALNKLLAEGSISNEDYAKSLEKIKLKLLETKDDAVSGLERAEIKLAQERRNAAKYVEEAYTSIQKPLEDYKNKLAALNFLQEQGKITSAQYATEIDKIRLNYLNNQTDPVSGFERGFIKIRQTATDTATVVEQAMTNAFKGAEDAFVNFVKTGKVDFKSLTDSIISDLSRLVFRQAFSGLFGGGGGGLGGLFGGGGGGGLLGGLFGGGSPLQGPNPDGSVLGSGGGFLSGLTSLFSGIGFATGGEFTVPGGGGVDGSTVAFRASAGERVSIKRPGEDGGGGARQAPIIFNISTPDAGSFKASQSQISASVLRAMRAGARNT